jgi:hypothetical protein
MINPPDDWDLREAPGEDPGDEDWWFLDPHDDVSLFAQDPELAGLTR